MPFDLKDIATLQNDSITLTLGDTVSSTVGWTVPYLNIQPENAASQEGGQFTLLGAGTNGHINIDNLGGHARVHTLATGKGLQVLTSDGVTTIRGDIIVSENWITPTFLNAWTNYDTTFNQCGYFKDKFGIVHLKGLVKGGTMAAAIFTLPAGYRPERRYLFQNQSAGAPGRVDVLPTGEVNAQAGANGWISLDSLHFRAYQ